MSEPENKIAIAFKLEGSSRDDGLVRFADFATFIEGTLAALRALERARTNQRHARIEYRITQLEVSSASLTIEAVDTPELRDTEQVVATRFAQGLAAVRDGLGDIAAFEPQVREALTRMLAPLKRGVRSITASFGETEIAIVGRTDGLLTFGETTEESAAVASFSGSVDALNVHGDHFFYLYPAAGPTRIKCVFDASMLGKVRDAVKRYTTVRGLVEYAEPSPFPQRIIVEDLDPHPDPSTLPTMKSLWGKYPNLTRGLDAVAFIEQMRDA
jgi:hypothetical protein